MSLPLPVIDRLFERLIATYGQEFVNKYQGDLNQVKSVWAHELSGCKEKLEVIAWALSCLPERAPNVIEFRNLCRSAPSKEPIRIEPPAVDKEIMRMVVAGIKPIEKAGRLDWAHRIIERKEQGAKVSPTVLTMAKEALGLQ